MYTHNGGNCHYCGEEVGKYTEEQWYGRDYRGRIVWGCRECNASVGSHDDGFPLGYVGDSNLRYWRKRAHQAFDPLWLRKAKVEGWNCRKARTAAYTWIGNELQTHPDETHIAMFDVEQCQKLIEICRPYN